MSGHPAPWSYEVHELSEGFSAIVYDANGACIVDHLDEPTAAKIAAAPELYEACAEAEFILCSDSADGEDIATALGKIKSALAKARGEA